MPPHAEIARVDTTVRCRHCLELFASRLAWRRHRAGGSCSMHGLRWLEGRGVWARDFDAKPPEEARPRQRAVVFRLGEAA